jgi:hypothetical protein
MPNRFAYALLGCLCWTAAACAKHPPPAPEEPIGELRNALFRAAFSGIFTGPEPEEPASPSRAQPLGALLANGVARVVSADPSKGEAVPSGRLPENAQVTNVDAANADAANATREPTSVSADESETESNATANVASDVTNRGGSPESKFATMTLPEPQTSVASTADQATSAATTSSAVTEPLLPDTRRSGEGIRRAPPQSADDTRGEPAPVDGANRPPYFVATYLVPDHAATTAIDLSVQRAIVTEIQSLYGAGPGFTGGSAGASGYTGVGAGPGSTGVGAGPGDTGVGAGPGSTGVGAGPGDTGVGAGPGDTGIGAGPGYTGVGAGPGSTGVGAGPGSTGIGASNGRTGVVTAQSESGANMTGECGPGYGGWGVIVYDSLWGTVLKPVAVY